MKPASHVQKPSPSPVRGGPGWGYQYLLTALPVFQYSGGAAYKPGLQTIGELDDFYGNPHLKYKTIHVAGTNGKGSVSHMLAAVLQGAGYKTGLFTSPHLVDFRERIKINGQMISEEDVDEFVARSKDLFDKVGPSFFEATAAMAFDYFARERVDIAVIETGMGGLLDATNIITPVLSVITNVSLDHTQFLGNNIIAIAAEKAGIIKPGVPVVVGETQPGPDRVFEDKARESDGTIFFADRLARVSRTEHALREQTFYVTQNEKEEPLRVTVDLPGDYQQKNIITALIAVQCLHRYAGVEIDPESIIPSLARTAKTTGLRGRWQVLLDRPYVVCDAGHNPAGLAWAVGQIGTCKYRKLHMIIGFVNDKDISGMLELLPREANYYFTKASIPRALDEIELSIKAEEYGLHGELYPEVKKAMEAALQNADKDDMIFIGGSIFVIAEVLGEFENR